MYISLKNNKAFTLVELIVVVTILAILATIGFLSLTGFQISARESARLNDVWVIRKQLEIYEVTNGNYPLPDNAVTITASGSTIGYQGTAGTGVLTTIRQWWKVTDPLDGSFYSYYVSEDQQSVQLLAMMEWDEALLSYKLGTTSNTYAATDYTERYAKTFWDSLWILTGTDNTPIEQIDGLSNLDVVSTVDSYISHISDSETLRWTWSVIHASMTDGSCKRIQQTWKSIWSGIYTINPRGTGNISVYCDMDTDGGGWTRFPQSMMDPILTNATILYESSDEGLSATIVTDNTWHYCGSAPNPWFKVQIQLKKEIGNFTQIMYTQEFLRNAACWTILWDNDDLPISTNIDSNLDNIKFLEQNKMWWSNGNTFVWNTHRCDNEISNFWHGVSGSFWSWPRKIEVIQNILDINEDTYISMDTGCANSDISTIYTNISVR